MNYNEQFNKYAQFNKEVLQLWDKDPVELQKLFRKYGGVLKQMDVSYVVLDEHKLVGEEYIDNPNQHALYALSYKNNWYIAKTKIELEGMSNL